MSQQADDNGSILIVDTTGFRFLETFTVDKTTNRGQSPLFDFLEENGRAGRWFQFTNGAKKSSTSEALANFKDNKLLESPKLFEENQLCELFLDRHDLIGSGSIFVFHNAISSVPFLTSSIAAEKENENDLPPRGIDDDACSDTASDAASLNSKEVDECHGVTGDEILESPDRVGCKRRLETGCLSVDQDMESPHKKFQATHF